ncbi:MAG: NAD(P)/FAD-dependent oxidoreductase [Acidobacteriota bacterium]|nr:NAD(P)/FAD-dependent oxidoreductase [Acidobacteriota bacterium]
MTYDAIIVGGGPAGLSAALVLGRCRRQVLLCDSGHYRNSASAGVHSFFTRDGTPPAEMLGIGRKQLEQYGVELRDCEVTNACFHDDGFLITLADGTELVSRKLLLATGVRDHLPDLPGIQGLYGKSVHHCPYCDAWEWRDRPLAVYGRKRHGFALALALLNWSKDIVLVTNGHSGLTVKQKSELARLGIPVRTGLVDRLEGVDGRLTRVLFQGGEALEREALFFSTGQDQCCDLTVKLGCVFTNKGTVKTDLKGDTNVPGLYVAGDAGRDVQFVIVAAAEGAKAGVAINEALQAEQLKAT